MRCLRFPQKAMRRPAAFLLVLSLVVLTARHLLVRPPAWLDGDPLLHPFGLQEESENSAGAAAKPAQEAPVTSDDPLLLNAAAPAELTRLPGVGPVLARRIAALRDSLGGLVDAAQLLQVRGIGPKTLERLAPLLRLQPAPADSTTVATEPSRAPD
jgi:hypothetical protein